jgi:hypothetical protein
MKTLIRSFVALAVVALGASLALAGEDNPLATPPQGRDYLPSSVIFPDQSIPTRFFHDKHIAQEVDCTQCHERAPESVSSTDQLIPVGSPGEETCATCHDFAGGATADPVSACSTCHTNYEPIYKPGRKEDDFHAVQNPPAAMVLPPNNLKMNHKLHTDKGITCATCHGDLKNVQVATRANSLPVMYTCLDCHNGQKAPDECRVCHFTEQSGRMITKFDSGTLMPAGHFRNDAHDDGWLDKHAMTAKNDSQYCANCHSPKYCLDCHNGVVKPFKVHPNNWVLTHPLHAKTGDPSCTSCHRSQSSCMDCHKRMGVAPKGEFSGAASAQGWKTSALGKFHPAGWVGEVKNGSSRGENNHAFMAQRNLRSCAACHTEKTCVGCHASGTKSGAGINPHPPNFGDSAKCGSLRATNSRMCANCHMPVPECD